MIFKNKEEQIKLLNRFSPGFIKFDRDGKIEINRTVKLNIPLENMIISSKREFNQLTVYNENKYDESLFSSDIKVANGIISKSKNIYQKSFITENQKEKHKKSKYGHYKHYINQSYIKITIPQKNFILDENIKEEFKVLKDKKTDKEKLNELFKLYNKYGFGIPFEFILGGKYYIYFDAKNEEEREEIEKKINNLTSLNFNEQKPDFNINLNNEETGKMEDMNFKIDAIGGDLEKKNDFTGWIKSLNLDNYEIIRYESVIPIHNYLDDELKNEIENLLKRENENLN